MYPKTFFASDTIPVENGYCFMLMAFAQQFNDVYDAIRDALEGVNFSCKRADEMFGGGHIIEDILREIARAEVVIADVTSRNPNVFYELGITHTVKDIDKVLILTQTMDDVPFDLRQFRCLVYEQSPHGIRRLKRQLIDNVQAIAKAPYSFSVNSGQSYKFPHKLPGLDKCLYDFEVSQVMTGENSARFRLNVFKHSVKSPNQNLHNSAYGLETGEFLDSREIPNVPWRLKLDSVVNETAYFLIIPQSSK